VLIRGMAGFLERKQAAKKMEEDRQRRENEVFLLDVSKKAPRTSFTVPQPFKLATDSPERRT
jgi:hypothetical protein